MSTRCSIPGALSSERQAKPKSNTTTRMSQFKAISYTMRMAATDLPKPVLPANSVCIRRDLSIITAAFVSSAVVGENWWPSRTSPSISG